jgi:hypothetical protein
VDAYFHRILNPLGIDSMRDFTDSMYYSLCKEMVNSPYSVITFENYFKKYKMTLDPCIILRHDVDEKPQNALTLGKIEHDFGICSTFYFRMVPHVFVPDIIRKLVDLGHEIGYHYEVLDQTEGDYGKARLLFIKNMETLRQFYDIKTACMHGNPITPWINKDFWTHFSFEEFGILGEPYISVDYSSLEYFTDTGRSWNSKFSVKDIVPRTYDKKIRNTSDLIQIIREENFQRMCINIHPHRWNQNLLPWFREYVWQNIKNVGKGLINISRRQS